MFAKLESFSVKGLIANGVAKFRGETKFDFLDHIGTAIIWFGLILGAFGAKFSLPLLFAIALFTVLGGALLVFGALLVETSIDTYKFAKKLIKKIKK